MRQATFTEVRNHAKQYFDIVESGESVRVLRNGVVPTNQCRLIFINGLPG